MTDNFTCVLCNRRCHHDVLAFNERLLTTNDETDEFVYVLRVTRCDPVMCTFDLR